MMQDERTFGLVAAFLALGGIAVAGWVRPASPDAPLSLNASNVGNSEREYLAPNQAAPSQASAYSSPYEDSYQQDGYYLSTRPAVYVHQDVPKAATEEVMEAGIRARTIHEGRRDNRVYRTDLHGARSSENSAAGGAGFVYDRPIQHQHH